MELGNIEVSLFGKKTKTVFALDSDGVPRAKIGDMNLTGEALTADQLRDIASLLERFADEVERLEGLSNE